MYVAKRKFVCGVCEHRYDQEILQDIPVSVFIKHLKTLRCPACGAWWKKQAFDLKAEREEMKKAASACAEEAAVEGQERKEA